MMKLCIFLSLVLVLMLGSPVFGDQIVVVDKASLSGYGAPSYQDFTVPKFDSQGGTLQLTAVTLDLLTSTSGGYTTDGSGISVHIVSSLTADYYRDVTLLAETHALIDQVVKNPAGSTPVTVHVYNTDAVIENLTDPVELKHWVGNGDLTLTAFTEFIVDETPPDIIYFGAGGSVYYTLIYTYEHALTSDISTLSAATGGRANFTLDAGTPHANRNYFILGSVSGTEPGTSLPGGSVTLPLNWDVFTDQVIYLANSPSLLNFHGVLDVYGKGSAKLSTFGPLAPSYVGVELNFAYLLYYPVVYYPYDFVSNPVTIGIVP
jgi:hypothetical protein